MVLLTKELEERFKEIGEQRNTPDPVVIAKFFNPAGAGTWYATAYYPEDKLFFGYVSIFGDHCDEWGYFSLQELEEFRGLLDLEIERDLYCGEFPISEVTKKP